MYFSKLINSPVGMLKLIGNNNSLVAVLWGHEDPRFLDKFPSSESSNHPILQNAELQINEYFEGIRSQFELPLELIGTEFQKKVWKQLQNIPFGETCSYQELSNQLNNPKAVRAIASAIGKNPLSLVIPCHRVIGKDRSLRGFAGGLLAKKMLLEAEGMVL